MSWVELKGKRVEYLAVVMAGPSAIGGMSPGGQPQWVGSEHLAL